ncbi:carbon-nitrogen hydrolase family protein [Candidatus Babeliales bacterium]|nr:carbon-nitrogen hydrolase family protein [Candidatus Babeliales bacterium]MCF7899711.1 carbon-nitrogen hydrolase family protein [Candidatus Babeliales bacterium]
MSLLKIALLQMSSCGLDQEKNLQKGIKFCERAASMGADIALFPEMWNIGYTSYNPHKKGIYEKWLQNAITIDSDFIKTYRLLAKKLNMAIAITYLEKLENSKPRNTVSLIDRNGEIVLTYAKIHLCDFDFLEFGFTAGNEFSVCDLDTKIGKVKIGAMICFDREFPESARILMLRGADIILVPNACNLVEDKEGFGDIRLQQIKVRAFENMTCIAVTNYAKPDDDGYSCAFDMKGRELIVGDNAENIFIAKFDIAELRRYRDDEVWGHKFRKVNCYGDLIKNKSEK